MNTNVQNQKTTAAAGRKDGGAALLARAKTGEKEALGALYEATYPEVWRTIRSMVSNEDDAMDILQDTYVKAFPKLGQIRDGASLRPWLRQTAANTARDFLRRKKPVLFSDLQKEEDDGELPFDPEDDRLEASPETKLDRQETQRLIGEMLDGLSDVQRLVIGMYYYQELPVKTIAEQLGVPENTVKSQLRYGRQKIEKRVRVLEKQGVKLCGAAPMAFFRRVFRDGLAASEPPAKLERIGARAARAAASVSRTGGTVKAVTAKSMLLRRLLVGVGVLAAAGGIAAGVGMLLGRSHTQGNVRLPSAEETAVLLETVREDEDPPADGVFRPSSWQESFLGILSGRIPEGQTQDPDGWPQEMLMNSLGYAAERAEYEKLFSLYDGDGDGNPELFVGDLYVYDRYSWTGQTVRWQNVSYLDFDHRSSVLLFREDGSFACCMRYEDAAYVEADGTLTVGFELCTGRPQPLQAPGSGTLSRSEGTSLPAELEAYYEDGLLPVLGTLRLKDTGEEYYLRFGEYDAGAGYIPVEYLDEAAYRAAEQALLSSFRTRLFDTSGSERLQAIPAAEGQGPMTYLEVVDLLGGFPAGEEWAYGAQMYEGMSLSFPAAFALAAPEPDALRQKVEKTYPAAEYGGCGMNEWRFGFVRIAGEWAPVLIAVYEQTPEEGGRRFIGCCFFGAEEWTFREGPPVEEGDLLYTMSTTLYCLRPGRTADGKRSLRIAPCEYPCFPDEYGPYESEEYEVVVDGLDQYSEEGQRTYQKLLLLTREEIGEKLSAHSYDYEQDAGEDLTLVQLMQNEELQGG